MMRNLQIISINHLSHTSQECLALDLSNENWEKLFAYMKYSLNVEGYVHLSTCNRIEIYYEADADLRYLIIDKWIALLGTESVDNKRFKTYLGSSICIQYLLELSVGFHSAILGDDQILAQLKKQFQIASSNRTLSTLLERAFQTIMKSHKQICKETDYRKQTVSLAYHSLKSIYQHISPFELSTKNLLIIGAGDMAAQVVKYLDKFTFRSVDISNRTIEKAQALTIGKNISVIPYPELITTEYDIIISCSDYGFEMISLINELDYYIDLSVKSSAHQNITIPHLRLVELQEFIKAQNVKRFSSQNAVNKILEEHATTFSTWVGEWKLRRLSTQL